MMKVGNESSYVFNFGVSGLTIEEAIVEFLNKTVELGKLPYRDIASVTRNNFDAIPKEEFAIVTTTGVESSAKKIFAKLNLNLVEEVFYFLQASRARDISYLLVSTSPVKFQLKTYPLLGKDLTEEKTLSENKVKGKKSLSDHFISCMGFTNR